MEQLRDIKPIVEVPDASLWWLLLLVAVSLLFLGLLAAWFVRLRRKRIDRYRAEALRRLSNLEWEETKQSVYDFTLLARYAVTPKTEATLEELLRELEPYKFKKEVPPLDAQTRARMETFIKEVRRG